MKWLVLLAWLAASSITEAQPRTIQNFESLDAWKLMPSDGVRASTRLVSGTDGSALRLEYNFEAGAGFVVLRFAVPVDLGDLGDNFRFTFQVRGQGPRNNLEFKLVDPGGDNVWWVNQRAFDWPASWKLERMPARKIGFAWGPAGASSPNPRPERLGFVEFAIAASDGGAGHVDFDSLTFERLPSPVAIAEKPEVQPRSGNTIDIDLKQPREFGGVILDWDENNFAADYDILSSGDGEHFEPVAEVRGGAGGMRYIPIEDGEGKRLRISIREPAGQPHLRGAEVPGTEFGASLNNMFAWITARAQPGLLPRYFRGEQVYWTIVGVPEDRDEALMSTDGALEIGTGGFSVEPFLRVGDGLISWADSQPRQSLEDGYLPIPHITWSSQALELDITAWADGTAGSSVAAATYTVRNTGNASQSGSLILAVRPFQVLPPSQNLNITGGTTPIRTLGRQGEWISVNGQQRIRTLSSPSGWGTSGFHAGDIVDRLARGQHPDQPSASDPMGLASGALNFDFHLAPGESATYAIETILRPGAVAAPSHPLEPAARLAASKSAWESRLNRVRLSLPRSAQCIVDTFRTTQAYILINQDGPAIQPGSRSYERSWIRDGSMTGASLLETGHSEDVRRFIEWYASYQYPTGKVPCVVDRRGPDPVPEHDSHGQLIFAIWNYFLYTGDSAFLERMWPRIAAAADYIDTLRYQRMTDQYRSGTPEDRAKFGLMPESISHEGYSAKPMHSYWDSFFVVKGLRDAVAAAAALNKSEDVQRIGSILSEYRAALRDSISLAMKNKGIDYIPGCVELGDFDATSTAIGIYPCDAQVDLPPAALERTLDKYYKFFRDRRDGKIEWKDYTPYELRIATAFFRTGHSDRAHELLDFFFTDQRPRGWNQWAEVVGRDSKETRFIGDMPHTWVGSEFLHAVRSMMVYEQGTTLILAAGVKPEWPWSDDGVQIERFPTEFGTLSYTLRGDQDSLILKLGPGLRPAPDRCSLIVPSQRLISRVNSPNPTVRLEGAAPQRITWDGNPTTIIMYLEGK